MFDLILSLSFKTVRLKGSLASILEVPFSKNSAYSGADWFAPNSRVLFPLTAKSTDFLNLPVMIAGVSLGADAICNLGFFNLPLTPR